MMPSAAQAAGKPSAAEEEQRRKAEEEHPEKGGQVLRIHTAHPAVPVPYVTPEDLKAGAQALASRLPTRPALPTPPARDLLFYGGLGALAVAGALEWPIAVAIGGATMVVRGRTKGETKERQETDREKEKEKA
jgi:hypothetical protein